MEKGQCTIQILCKPMYRDKIASQFRNMQNFLQGLGWLECQKIIRTITKSVILFGKILICQL